VITKSSQKIARKKEGGAMSYPAFRLCILPQLVPIIRQYQIEPYGTASAPMGFCPENKSGAEAPLMFFDS
jgi:hypothetical protein